MYTVDYFIAKFSLIPEDKWAIGIFATRKNIFSPIKMCAQGFCLPNKAVKAALGKHLVYPDVNDSSYKEVFALVELFGNSKAVARINNGKNIEYQQSTPRRRILAALNDIKKKQEEETGKPKPKETVKEIIRYVSVTAEIREDAKEKILETSN